VRVAVTGGSGQLGTLLLRRLADDRRVKEIVALDLRPPLIVSGKLRDVRADVRDPGIGEHLRGCEALIHLAFLVAKRGARSLQDDVNVRGSANVFRAALASGVRRILHASSVAAYGVVPGLPRPVTEETPRVRQPDFWYGCAKHDVEADLDALERDHPELSVTRFRPAILIGRRMEHRLGSALRHGLLPRTGPLPVVWDEDVADAFLLALRTEAKGAFNLAADEPLPSAELAKEGGLRLLRLPRGPLRALERAAEALHLLAPADPGWLAASGLALVYSSEKAKRELGWKPRCPTAREVIRCYAANVPRKVDRRIAFWARVVDRASRAGPGRVELKGYDATVHLDLTGPGGGDFTLRVAEERVRLRAGVPRPANATVSMKAATLLDLLAGRGDLAAAQLTGKIRIDGQGHAGLVLGGLVAGFRDAGRLPGWRGFTARRLQRWIAA
jgi:nucleoside-diphosphate-sugar epimerase/putative sterol carrier protein